MSGCAADSSVCWAGTEDGTLRSGGHSEAGGRRPFLHSRVEDWGPFPALFPLGISGLLRLSVQARGRGWI